MSDASLLDHPEYERWREEADTALRAARTQAEAGIHNWSCFLAEQSAQLAIKGLLHGVGRSAWGHDLVRLGETAAQIDPSAWKRVEPALRTLSRHYIPARDPDAHPGGTSGSHYGAEDAEEALRQAEEILRAAEETWRSLTRSAKMAEPQGIRAVLERRRAEGRELLARAGRFAEALPEELEVRAVVVFGSVARGDFNLWSDIDVLVIAENLPERPQDRIGLLLRSAPSRIAPVAWTSSELQQQIARNNPIARESLAQGVLLRGELPAGDGSRRGIMA